MTHNKLGKIAGISFGWGGYQDAMLGLSLSFSMDGTGVNTFVGGWGIKHDDRCKWTEQDRLIELGKAVMKLGEMLTAAHKTDVSELVGTPIQVTLEGNTLVDWRLLTEVL